MEIFKTRDIKTIPIQYTSEEEAKSALSQLCLYIVFLIALTVASNSVAGFQLFYFNDSVKGLFGRSHYLGSGNNTINFNNIITVDEYWKFLNNGVFPLLHGENIYSEITQNQTNSFDKPAQINIDPLLVGHIFLGENLVLGPPRLRQIRVKKDSCALNYAFIRYFNDCVGAYTMFSESTEPIYKGTKFYTRLQLGTTSIRGELATYYGAGYLQEMSYVKEENHAIIKKLQNIHWIDRATRLVIFELNLYNINLRIFSNIKYMIEILPTGSLIPLPRFYSIIEDPYFSKSGWGIFICAAIMHVINVYYAFWDFKEIIKFGFFNFIFNLAHIHSVIRIIIIITSLIYMIFHYISISNIMYKVHTSSEFISIDSLSFWYHSHKTSMGLLIYVSWICLFRFFDCNPVLRTLSHAISDSAMDLGAFVIMFLIVYCSFGVLGHLLFGNSKEAFRYFPTAVVTMMRMLIGDFDYASLGVDFQIMGPLYVLTYTLLCFFILLNMFLAVIVLAYRTSRKSIHSIPNFAPYIVGKYLHRISKGYIPLPKYPIRQDQIYANEKMNVNKIVNIHLKKKYEDALNDLQILNTRIVLIIQVLQDLTENMDNLIRIVEEKQKEAAKKKKKMK